MIINTGLRTDIIHHYSDWLFRRFREGFAYSRNPIFPNKVTSYELSPEKVDAVVFCSKNYAKALPRIHEITDRFRTYFYYTITAYGKDVEPDIPSIDESIQTLIVLSKIVGKQRVAWRYDPVLITKKYTADCHFETFEYILSRIHARIDRCIFSFVEMFAAIQMRMPEIIPLTPSEKQTLAFGFGKIAKKYSALVQTCDNGNNYSQGGVLSSGCTTLGILANANGCVFQNIKHNGMKRSCRCLETRDLGWYDTCPSFCKYCNANHHPNLVTENVKQHDPYSPLLIGNLQESDKLQSGTQISYLKNDGRQISLFDL